MFNKNLGILLIDSKGHFFGFVENTKDLLLTNKIISQDSNGNNLKYYKKYI